MITSVILFSGCVHGRVLPREQEQAAQWLAGGKQTRTLIVKPNAGCQGDGIRLVQRPRDVPGASVRLLGFVLPLCWLSVPIRFVFWEARVAVWRGALTKALHVLLVPLMIGGGGLIIAIPAVAQQYIPQPLCLDGVKFDLRLYVLLTSLAPLRAFVHTAGMVRLATEQYTAPQTSNLVRPGPNQVAGGESTRY